FGDMDGDGQVNTNDLNNFGAYITKNTTLTDAQKKAMNLDNDARKRLNTNDLLRLQSAVSSGAIINQVNPAQ
ncbi:MAG: hypothetical protein IJZ57_05590, partial [Clostridia bacterium]|nr:hypothetical protein [Clostridia bacterium]MBQ8783225.1 hypothetical protein [Clostridia bacterium]